LNLLAGRHVPRRLGADISANISVKSNVFAGVVALLDSVAPQERLKACSKQGLAPMKRGFARVDARPGAMWITGGVTTLELAEVPPGSRAELSRLSWQVQSPISGLDIGDPLRGDGDFIAFG